MLEVHVDRSRCEGYGNCLVAAPEVFDLDDENIATVRSGRPVETDGHDVEEAAADCPVRAILVGNG